MNVKKKTREIKWEKLGDTRAIWRKQPNWEAIKEKGAPEKNYGKRYTSRINRQMRDLENICCKNA